MIISLWAIIGTILCIYFITTGDKTSRRIFKIILICLLCYMFAPIILICLLVYFALCAIFTD